MEIPAENVFKLLQFLYKNNALEVYANARIKYLKKRLEEKDLFGYENIGSSFVWADTLNGREYWRKLAIEYIDYVLDDSKVVISSFDQFILLTPEILKLILEKFANRIVFKFFDNREYETLAESPYFLINCSDDINSKCFEDLGISRAQICRLFPVSKNENDFTFSGESEWSCPEFHSIESFYEFIAYLFSVKDNKVLPTGFFHELQSDIEESPNLQEGTEDISIGSVTIKIETKEPMPSITKTEYRGCETKETKPATHISKIKVKHISL